jgi:hypothetical protein
MRLDEWFRFGHGEHGTLRSRARNIQFSPAGTMTTPRAAPAAILLPDGRVLIAGGSSSLGPNLLIYYRGDLQAFHRDLHSYQRYDP